MLFTTSSRVQTLLGRILRIRRNPALAYGIAVGCVAVAVAARAAIGGQLMDGLPFITFYPAVLVAALVGGFGPGIAATVLSLLMAWFLFIPPAFTFVLDVKQVTSLILFALLAGMNVALAALLSRSLEAVRTLLESAPTGIVVVDERGYQAGQQQRRTALRVPERRSHRSGARGFGARRSSPGPHDISRCVPAEPRDSTHGHRSGPARQAQGRQRVPRRRQDGKTGVLATVIDITERRKEHERQEFLMRELRHRAQNLFALIQAIATRSFAKGRRPAEAKEVFMGRLSALARTHAMLADSSWEGASLSEIISRELSSFLPSIRVSGCEVVLTTPAAQAFALIFHELATNAVKYGALSSPARADHDRRKAPIREW
jgi:PAS domain-containing protein